MTDLNLLDNLPIEKLTPETDYLGLIEKGDLIKTFLKGNKDQFNRIKMLSLYGEWGSGKSTLMKYLEKELKAGFNTYFFEAWQYEKDDNLAISLRDVIVSKSKNKGELNCDAFLKVSGKVLKGFGKATSLGSKLIGEFEKEEESTFYEDLEQFKFEFKTLEDEIKASTQKEYNIVFIDDLDRCEPEQVLNLLSAIKLFFTYGQKTIFFCGIDKKAAEEAVKTKYGEVVKSNEYLEKIFDISFTMPVHDSLQKMINHYFLRTEYFNVNGSRHINFIVQGFFQKIGFTNPRRVKKVLNKYQILRNIKERKLLKNEVLPNIDVRKREPNSLFETILVLYLIILHEFYPLFFKDFLNFEKKALNLNRISYEKRTGEISLRDIVTIGGIELSECPFNELKHYGTTMKDNRLSITICPTNFESLMISREGMEASSLLSDKRFLSKEKSIELDFYEFIMNNSNIIYDDHELSSATFASVKKLIAKAL
ncbi:MAG: hypothetical protein BM557_02805 [Flavobacterium sp. MedPE-SWcel]|uniref:KAP family P-loop NTPase fold protein n=1 Tax=uncultured Flavobacterium sp. TaxID=165435 RepID=UPI0009192D8C|nr:P-loop NTPase fold protein [uncultured Flavobacterium sp.]OIQ21743.1 MAG: hypothetical protein BM557_02805 [Flavobacterium sp. MedPE-SWcel]